MDGDVRLYINPGPFPPLVNPLGGLDQVGIFRLTRLVQCLFLLAVQSVSSYVEAEGDWIQGSQPPELHRKIGAQKIMKKIALLIAMLGVFSLSVLAQAPKAADKPADKAPVAEKKAEMKKAPKAKKAAKPAKKAAEKPAEKAPAAKMAPATK